MKNHLTWPKITDAFQIITGLLIMLIYTVIFIAAISSCSPSKKDRIIEGQWFGVDWTIDGQPAGYDPDRVAFQFNADGTYQYAYQDLEESGTYFITGQQLYTTPAGGTKIMVRIKSMTTDTLQIEMNRGGQLELLTLGRN